jgi:AcrR family transcriptional regulator
VAMAMKRSAAARAANTASEPSQKGSELFRKKQMLIVKAAAKLFMEKGYASASMRDISRATDIDIGNLYYFIKSKEEILYLVFDMVHRPVGELFHRLGVFDIDDPETQLRAAVHQLIDFGFRYKEEILLLYRESRHLPEDLLRTILARESSFIDQIAQIYRKGAERGVFDVPDPAFAANMLAFQLAFFPLRRWNMRQYTKAQLLELAEQYIMKAVMKC